MTGGFVPGMFICVSINKNESGSIMALWFGAGISASCFCISLYMSYLTYEAGSGGFMLFALFGILSLGFFQACFRQLVAIKCLAVRDSSGKPPAVAPVRFVPHFFILAAILVSVLIILVMVLAPLANR